MATQIFLGLSALLWSSYGLYCFFAPGSLVEAAGVVAQTATGTTEVRAMYGGLQSSLGVLLGAAALRASLVRPALLTVAFVTGGLGIARALGLLLDGSFSSYTAMGLGFEFASAGIAITLLRRHPGQATDSRVGRRAARRSRAKSISQATDSRVGRRAARRSRAKSIS